MMMTGVYFQWHHVAEVSRTLINLFIILSLSALLRYAQLSVQKVNRKAGHCTRD